jgi:3-oxoacyl-[acyl-carrier protein] reductase
LSFCALADRFAAISRGPAFAPAAKAGRSNDFTLFPYDRAEEVETLIVDFFGEFGKIDLVVNNAGTYERRPIVSVDEDHFDRHFDLNVKGLFFATQAAVSAFGERGGSIINISSIAASSPVPNLSVYSATKAAVDAFTKSLAAELGPKQILANSVLPGATDTPGATAMAGSAEARPHLVSQTPLGRIGQPRDIANVVAFLASGDAAWITGQLIPVSGGLHF